MKKSLAIVSFLLLYATGLFASAPLSKSPVYANCGPILETKDKKKPIKFLFWTPVRFSVKTIDNIVFFESNRNLKATSYSLWSLDAGDFIKFNRLQINKDEIYEYRLWFNSKSGRVITYNLCGKRIRSEKLPQDEFWDKYYEVLYKR